jgi:hypothetical protein
MKICSIVALLLLSASICFAQAPTAALYTSSSDVYVGYVITVPDYGPKFSLGFNGGEIAYTRNVMRHLSVIASARGVFGSIYDVNQYSGTLGPKYSPLNGRIRPYATVQIGFSRQRSNRMYAGDHHPPLTGLDATYDHEQGLTYLGGGGLDLLLTHRLYWRAAQFDYQAQPWGRHTPFYSNFSSGVGYRF